METSLTGKALNFGFSEYRFESYVSNIKKNFLHFITKFKINVAKKNIFFDMRVTRTTRNILLLFENMGLIKSYYFHNLGYCRIFILYSKYYKNNRKIKLYLRKNEKLQLSNKLLVIFKLISPTSSLILQTNKGFITHKEALYNNVGGKLIAIIF